ncbi:hypothetical protein ACRJ4W_35660 [Streptomyces sp. GLT-R25]
MAEAVPPTAAEREALTGDLLQGARSRVVQLQEAATACAGELARSDAQLSAERTSIESATRAAHKARKQAGLRDEGLKAEQHGLLASWSSVPAPMRVSLPLPPQLPAPEHLEAAAEAVRTEQGRQKELAGRLERLREAVQSLLTEQGALTQRQQREVADPLHSLEARLQRWADSVDSAAALVEESVRPVMPSLTAANDPAAAHAYAVALEAVSTLLLAALEEHDTEARAAMVKLTTQLSVDDQEVADAYPGTVTLRVTEETDPLGTRPSWTA